MIVSYLDGCGSVIQTDSVETGRSNVIASVPGEDSSHRLVWICHMDTVVIGSGWTKNPLEGSVEQNRIYGRGACDMKAGLACALSVFRKTALEVSEGKRSLKYPLCLICTVDEEGDMRGADHLVDAGYVTNTDYIMDLEPTGGEVQMAHKGRFWVELTIKGITAHASRPEEGADAIAVAGEIITGIRERVSQFSVHEELGRTTVTFGQIQGGYQPYVVPDQCRLWMDFRLAPPVCGETILEIVRQCCDSAKEKVPGIKAEYVITGDRPYVETNPQSVLLKQIRDAVKKVTGRLPEISVFPGYTDTAVIAGRTGNRECLSYGPGDLKYAHKPDEFVEIEDIDRCRRVLEELVNTMLK